MSDKLIPNSDIALTPQIIQQFKSQLITFENQYALCTQNFDSSPDIEYFILSTLFIKQWKELIKQACQEAGPDSHQVLKLPSKYNTELIQGQMMTFGEVELRMDLQEGIDFLIVNADVMKIFRRYQGITIARKAYYYGVQKMVERYPIKFQFSFISHSWLKLLKESKQCSLVLNKGLAYKNETVLDLLYRMVEYSKEDKRNRSEEYSNKTAAKVYVGRFEGTIEKYSESIRQHLSQQNSSLALLDQPGQQLRRDMIIGDLIIPTQNVPIMIIELEQKKFVFKPSIDVESESHDYCQFCRKKKLLEFQCKCKEVKYCSKDCQERDWRYHSKSCEALMEEDNTQPEFKIEENSRKGLVGLKNLGNTCYMNAALQCLIHTSLLTNYFKEKLYIEQINEENPIGSKGKLLKSYAKFIENVLVTAEDVVAPHKFKYTVGKSKEMFCGYEQHDSQQFLLFVLDTLHEDLNRVRKKPYTNCIENEGRPDYEVAKQSWLTYLKRNQSFINDIMGGQYRSQVKCPDCLNISVTFDPYLIFSVPIPSKDEAKTINLYVFFSNYKTETLKMTVSSKNNVVKELREDVVEKTKSSLEEMKFFILGFNGRIRVVSDEETVDQLINQKQFNESGEERQLFSLQMTPEELENYEEKRMLVFKFKAKEKTLTFKRPLFFEINEQKKLMGKDIYDRVSKLIFRLEHKSYSHHEFTEQQLTSKYIVYRQKVSQKQKFKIEMAFGEPQEETNKIQYPNRLLIEEETDVSELLVEKNYSVEFEVVFENDPYYSFNSFRSYGSSFGSSQYSGYGQHKTGFDESYTLEQCLGEMKMSETLVKGNEVFCLVCGDFKLAQKKMQLFKASRCLIIQLRRFKQIGYEKSKNHAEIKYPEYIDLKDYILNDQLPEAYFAEGIQQAQKEFYYLPKYFKSYETRKSTKYRLYGVVNHSGSLTGGHYTAYGRHENQWYEFDDSYIRKIEKEGWNCGSSAYLLFYERVEEETEIPIKQVEKQMETDYQI